MQEKEGPSSGRNRLRVSPASLGIIGVLANLASRVALSFLALAGDRSSSL